MKGLSVTGGAGFVGSNVVHMTIEGAEVQFYSLSRRERAAFRFPYVSTDVSKQIEGKGGCA